MTIHRRALVAAAAAAALLSACGGDDDTDLLEVARSEPRLGTFVQAVEVAGLEPFLTRADPTTVFAPTNAAFADTLAELGLTEAQLFTNPALLRQVLGLHIVNDSLVRSRLPIDLPITTVGGGTFTVGPDFSLTDPLGRRTNILTPDLLADDGVLHVVDRVLLPDPAAII